MIMRSCLGDSEIELTGEFSLCCYYLFDYCQKIVGLTEFGLQTLIFLLFLMFFYEGFFDSYVECVDSFFFLVFWDTGSELRFQSLK